MRIDGLKKYQRRDRRVYFSDLPTPVRAKANEWLRRFCNRRGGNPPQWLFAIYVGQAKRLALNPPDSAWGRSMHARRGGRAVQRRYRLEGRHPTEKATQVSVLRRKASARSGRGNDDQSKGAPVDQTHILFHGICSSGLNGRAQGEALCAEIARKLADAISLDYRFRRNLAPPQQNWAWEVRLMPVPLGSDEP